jgi:hypothetical protein
VVQRGLRRFRILAKMRPEMGNLLLKMGLYTKIRPPPEGSGFEIYSW